ncbi:MAG: glycosyltransferase family 4 protein [Candidatus Zixiibacteriota bacterium]|jgi:glycosyltransferase involved in cell wall biosynthesis
MERDSARIPPLNMEHEKLTETVWWRKNVYRALDRSENPDTTLPRLLFVAPLSLRPRGACIQAELVSRHLRADGWPVDFISAGRLEEAFSGRLLRAVARSRILHVFVSSLGQLVSMALPAVVLGRFYGRRVIIHMHSGELGDWAERWRWFMAPVLRQADSVVVSSNHACEVLKEAGLHARVIECPVDIELFAARKIDKVQPHVVITGRLEPDANVSTVLRAFKLVKQKYPRAELTVVGDGSLRRQLEMLMEDELIHGVALVGTVSRTDMRRILERADIFVNACSRSDIPVTLFEAQACGLPVITVRSRAVAEAVTDGVNGLILDTSNHIEIADQIVRLTEDPALVSRISEAAIAASKKRGWGELKGRWSRLYTEILANRPG